MCLITPCECTPRYSLPKCCFANYEVMNEVRWNARSTELYEPVHAAFAVEFPGL